MPVTPEPPAAATAAAGPAAATAAAPRRRPRVVRLLPEMDFGGAESRVTLQAERLDRDAFDLRVCTFHKPGRAAERIRAAGVPVDVLGCSPLVRDPRAALHLARYLARVKPDILHASISEGMFHGALAGALVGVPAVIIEEVGIPTRSPFGARMMRRAYALADCIIGVAASTCDVLRAEGAPDDKLRLIYGCGKPEYFETALARDASPRPFRVLTVGRLVEVKNQATLMRAFAALLDDLPDAELWIAGDGPLSDPLAALRDDLGLADRVHLLGFRSDVKRLLEQSDVFALPSFTEGCSIALVEAMATRMPVIGSTAGGIVEVMGDLGDAWLIPPDDTAAWTDALRRCARLSDLERDALSQRAFDIAHERFAPRVYIDNLHALYDAFADLGARRGPLRRARRALASRLASPLASRAPD